MSSNTDILETSRYGGSPRHRLDVDMQASPAKLIPYWISTSNK